MSYKAAILKRFTGAADNSPLFLPDLTLWYRWHARRGTLPERWSGLNLRRIYAELALPAWEMLRPYTLDTGSIRVERRQTARRREIVHVAPSGTLIARWELGPDGDWWQTEYAVKKPSDLAILLEIVTERQYRWAPAKVVTAHEAMAGEGVVAIALPSRPFSHLLQEWLGWDEGLLLLFDAEKLVEQILLALEEKLQALVEQIVALPGAIVVSPDNLDAQFVSPGFFGRYLADSYRRTAVLLHQQDKFLLVESGGPIWHLLEHLAACGVDGVQGISGPPQSDAPLAAARELLGPDFTLWGGIPQDALLPDFAYERFEGIVLDAVRSAQDDARTILGIADRVPVQADIKRLQAVSAYIT